jgi:hypothetical protein
MIRIVKKGVHYKLKSFTGKTEQDIIFTHRDENRNPVEGTTREAHYLMMIDHVKEANKKRWSAENEIQIKLLERCLQSQRVTITAKVNESKDNLRKV